MKVKCDFCKQEFCATPWECVLEMRLEIDENGKSDL